MRPMKAAQFDESLVRFPLYVQPKIDGYRALIHNGVALSNTLKPHPNRYLQEWAEAYGKKLEGLDGELVVGSPTDPKTFNRTSELRRFGGTPRFTFLVFDAMIPMSPFTSRMQYYKQRCLDIPFTLPVESTLIEGLDALLHHEEKALEAGYEGLILRDPAAHYKHGRSTVREQALVKVKRFIDDDAKIIDYFEMMRNYNSATENALGLTERSHHQENKIRAGMLGGFVLKSDKWPGTFEVGSGFTEAQRKQYWDEAEGLIGQWIKFKHFPIGGKNLPRNPIFLGLRGKENL